MAAILLRRSISHVTVLAIIDKRLGYFDVKSPPGGLSRRSSASWIASDADYGESLSAADQLVVGVPFPFSSKRHFGKSPQGQSSVGAAGYQRYATGVFGVVPLLDLVGKSVPNDPHGSP